ncbi:MAG TPA: hypothetical protein EYQ31_05935, partial [Candidatus Handelsmanbacteria bacterium]|nr:hypothetical protein [Candidatus Handelsmanbacteria bacterium]
MHRLQTDAGEHLTQTLVVKTVQVCVGRRQLIAMHAQVVDNGLSVGHGDKDTPSSFRHPGSLGQSCTGVVKMLNNFGEHDG